MSETRTSSVAATLLAVLVAPWVATWTTTTAVLLACVAATQASAQQAAGAPAAPLEIIVKFSGGSDAGRRIERLLREGSGDLSALDATEARLEASLGVQLERERITSGREILFSVPERPLLEMVEAGAARRADVASTAIETLDAGNPWLPGARLLVRFRESSEAFATLQSVVDRGTASEGVRALAGEIGAASGVPVTGTPIPVGTLALIVERAALLSMLSARIGNLADVDYAQPNAPMQIMK